MNQSLAKLINKYEPKNKTDYENALHEIIQELALAGLWRSKFFEIGAFYGGTSLRILYELDRFSEDLDFSLLKPNPSFDLKPYLSAVQGGAKGETSRCQSSLSFSQNQYFGDLHSHRPFGKGKKNDANQRSDKDQNRGRY